MNKNMEIVFLILYFAGMLGIGLYYRSRQTSVSEFVTAGQGLGYWVATFSARTTGESGWLLLGLTGMGYAMGLSAFWVVLGETLGVAISWIFLVPKFKAEVTHYKSLTMLDYFEDKLGDHQHLLRYIFATVLLVMVTAYIAAQLTATGKAFHSFYGMDVMWAQALGLALILVYITLGGFYAVAISDFVQGILMLLGLICVPIFAVFIAGGVSPILETITTQAPHLLSVFPQGDNTFLIVLTILGLAGPGLGFLGSPQVYQRMIALKKESKLKRATVVAIAYTILTDGGAVLCGMAGRYFFNDLADVESVYPQLIETLFPPLLTGLFVAVILSAIMSTADSLLILASTTLVRDVYQKIINPTVTEKKAVFYLRTTTVLMSLLALAVASMEIRLIYWFALFGWAGIASSFCPPLILTLFWKGTNKYGVTAGAISGFLTTILWKVFSNGALYEMIPGFAIAFLMTTLFSLLFKKKARPS